MLYKSVLLTTLSSTLMSFKGFWGRGGCAGAPVYCRRPSPCYCFVISVVVVVDIVVDNVVDVVVVVVVVPFFVPLFLSLHLDFFSVSKSGLFLLREIKELN